MRLTDSNSKFNLNLFLEIFPQANTSFHPLPQGGIGKTVTALYTTAVLKAEGHEVVVLDNDPEGSAAGDLIG